MDPDRTVRSRFVTTPTVTPIDHFHLSRLVEQYCDGVVQHSVEIWGATWAEHASWDLGRGPIVGRDAIIDTWREAMHGFEWVVQVPSLATFHVEPGADVGTGRVVTDERFRRTDGSRGALLGVYHDDFVRVEGEWKFQIRRLEIIDLESH